MQVIINISPCGVPKNTRVGGALPPSVSQFGKGRQPFTTPTVSYDPSWANVCALFGPKHVFATERRTIYQDEVQDRWVWGSNWYNRLIQYHEMRSRRIIVYQKRDKVCDGTHTEWVEYDRSIGLWSDWRSDKLQVFGWRLFEMSSSQAAVTSISVGTTISAGSTSTWISDRPSAPQGVGQSIYEDVVDTSRLERSLSDTGVKSQDVGSDVLTGPDTDFKSEVGDLFTATMKLAQVDDLNDPSVVTSIANRGRLINVSVGTILSRDDLPREFMAQNSGLDSAYYVVDYVRVSQGQTPSDNQIVAPYATVVVAVREYADSEE